KLVRMDGFNPQAQPKLVWPASFVVARAYLDQLERSHGLTKEQLSKVGKELKQAEKKDGAKRVEILNALAGELAQDAQGSSEVDKIKLLEGTVTDLTGAAH